MRKLNRKGYLTVEVIISAVLAFVIAYFLIEITVQLINKTDNAYQDTVLMTDKALITKNIKELLESDIASRGGIKKIEKKGENYFVITFNDDTNKKIEIKDSNLYYGDEEYRKRLDDKLEYKLVINSITGVQTYDTDGYLNFALTATSIYLDDDYGFNFSVYNKKREAATSRRIKLCKRLGPGNTSSCEPDSHILNIGSESSLIGETVYPLFTDITCTGGTSVEVIKIDTVSNGGTQVQEVSFKFTSFGSDSDTAECTAIFRRNVPVFNVKVQVMGSDENEQVGANGGNITIGDIYLDRLASINESNLKVTCTNGQTASISKSPSGTGTLTIDKLTEDTVCNITEK